MPTVIDELVLELGIDPAKFSQGQKDAIDSFKKAGEESVAVGKSIEAQGSKVTDFFAGLKREALGLLGVFLGGRAVKEFVTDVTNLGAASGRTALTLNMSTRELSAWQGAAKMTGGSAASITSTMQGLSGAVNTFLITGQGPFLGVTTALGISLFDVNKKLKTAGELLLEISDKVKGMDPARAAAMLGMIPGMNQDTINLLINGRSALERLLATAREAGTISDEDAEAAMRLQAAWEQLEIRSMALGGHLLTGLIPYLKTIQDFLHQDLGEAAGSFWGWLTGKSTNFEAGKSMLAEKMAAASRAPRPSPSSSPGEQESYIRQAAAARGIDPNVAVAVAKSEGLNSYVGDRGTSFGPFQLHYKNNIPGLSSAGLGDQFTRQTGMDARDPSTWKAQVDFALDEAKKSGWGAWHGWKGLPNAGIGAGIGARGAAGASNRGGDTTSHTTSINISKLEVHSSKAGASDVADEIPGALKRANWAASANYGQTG